MSTASRFNSGVAILSIQPVQSLDLPELKIYLTLRRVVEHERQGVLVAANIKTIGDLIQKSEGQMLKYKNFGKKSLNEINAILVTMNLHLGMNIEDSLPNKGASLAQTES